MTGEAPRNDLVFRVILEQLEIIKIVVASSPADVEAIAVVRHQLTQLTAGQDADVSEENRSAGLENAAAKHRGSVIKRAPTSDDPLPSPGSYNITYYINAPIGQLNAGERQAVSSIDSHIAAVVAQGTPTIAQALKVVSDAVISDPGSSDRTRQEVLQSIGDLAEAAASPAEDRRVGRIKGAMSVITDAAVAATKLREVWDIWAPTISNHLHLHEI